MKLRSLSLITVGFLFMFGVFPSVAMQVNISYSLPVFEHVSLRIIGVILAVLGASIVAHSANVLFFSIGQDLPFPPRPPRQFVIAGLYRVVRNPMYLGDFLIILSEFFLFGHLLLLAYLLLAVVGVHVMVVRYEERGLREKFGQAYEEYTRTVPRWFPRL